MHCSNAVDTTVSNQANQQAHNTPPDSAHHVTDDSSISFASEAPTPIKRHHAPPSTRQDLATSSPPAWRPAEWSRSIDVGNDYHLNKSFPTGGGREEDVTARLYSSASGTDSSADEAERRYQSTIRARRHNSHGRMGVASYKHSGRDQRRAELDEAARRLRSQLAAARSQLEQKEIVTRSLQRQLDEVSSSRPVGDAARCYEFALPRTSMWEGGACVAGLFSVGTNPPSFASGLVCIILESYALSGLVALYLV